MIIVFGDIRDSSFFDFLLYIFIFVIVYIYLWYIIKNYYKFVIERVSLFCSLVGVYRRIY